jgi:hypothetical protein
VRTRPTPRLVLIARYKRCGFGSRCEPAFHCWVFGLVRGLLRACEAATPGVGGDPLENANPECLVADVELLVL